MPSWTRYRIRETRDRIRRGFTLVEILVAVALIGIVVSILYGSVAATTRSIQAYRARLSTSTRGHLALQQIAATLRCCCSPMSTHGAELRLHTTKPIIEDPGGPEGVFDVALRWDRATGTIVASQQRWRPPLSADAAPQAWEPLLDHVTDLQWSFWDGIAWKPDWDLSTNKALPRLARIDLTCQDAQDRRYDLQTLVSLWCTTQSVTGDSDANGPAKP